METYDLIILGGGGVGLAASMYASRLGLRNLILGYSHGSELPIGGVITTTNVVENYPGFIRLTGQEIAKHLENHARDYKDFVTIKQEKAEEIIKEKNFFKIKTKKETYTAKTILFATGTKWRKLPDSVKGSTEFENKGVAYCALCMPPEEDIITNGNILEIGKITPTTKILTKEGYYKNVDGFYSRDYSGQLISIRPRFFNEAVSLTPEHPVLTIKINKGQGANYWKDFNLSSPEWKKAEEVTTNDAVLYPIIKETEDKNFFFISDYLNLKTEGDFIIPRKTTYTSVKIKNKILLDKDFMRLVGYYLAEGSASRHELRFYFNKNEEEYISDVSYLLEKYFGIKPKINHKDSGSAISINSRIISDLFKILFNKYAHEKNIPHFMILLPESKQMELIKGFWRGDGCMREKDFTFITTSRKLAYQLRDILLRQNIIPSLQKRLNESLNKKTNLLEGREISFTKDKYHLTIGGAFLDKMSNIIGIRHPKLDKRKKSTSHAWIKDGYAILPVRETNKSDYSGKVISLSVKDTHSYVSKSFIVHNCDAPLFKNKIVAVVGGSDSSAKDAMVLAEHAKKVYIIARSTLHPEPINLQRIKANKKIEVIEGTQITEVKGDDFVKSVILDKPYKGKKELALEGVFVAIGHIMLSDLAKPLGVKLNQKGEIIIDHKTSETNIPGIFAAGDVTDKEFKQLITGVADGCTAAYYAYEYISKDKNKIGY